MSYKTQLFIMLFQCCINVSLYLLRVACFMQPFLINISVLQVRRAGGQYTLLLNKGQKAKKFEQVMILSWSVCPLKDTWQVCLFSKWRHDGKIRCAVRSCGRWLGFLRIFFLIQEIMPGCNALIFLSERFPAPLEHDCFHAFVLRCASAFFILRSFYFCDCVRFLSCSWSLLVRSRKKFILKASHC